MQPVAHRRRAANELRRPLVHRRQPDTRAAIRAKPTPVVLDDERQVGAAAKPQAAAGRARVAHGVCHRLGPDPVGRHLDRGREIGKRPVGRHVEGRSTGRIEPVGRQPEGAHEADLVDGRWSQPIDEAADVADRRGDLRLELGQEPSCRLRIVG
jgi:hypothetical protein